MILPPRQREERTAAMIFGDGGAVTGAAIGDRDAFD
jgi:hypothetical protein